MFTKVHLTGLGLAVIVSLVVLITALTPPSVKAEIECVPVGECGCYLYNAGSCRNPGSTWTTCGTCEGYQIKWCVAGGTMHVYTGSTYWTFEEGVTACQNSRPAELPLVCQSNCNPYP